MISKLGAFWNDQDGITTVEYALLLALIAGAAIGAFSMLGKSNRGSVASSVMTVAGAMDGQ